MGLLDQDLIIKDPNYSRKILLIDLENTPLVSYNWGIWQQDAIEVKEDWYLLCYGYKWLGEDKVKVVALPDFKTYKKQPENDYELVKSLHDLFEQAEIIVAHNGDQFDIKKANARFIYHGLEPPHDYKTIDTLKLARRYFKFDSNKLDYLGQYLKVGRKLPHTGKHLWFGCMHGDKKSWKMMIEYNKQDVILLDKIYKKLRGWNKKSPYLNLVIGRPQSCRNCGSEHFHSHGEEWSGLTKYKRYKCLNCGANIKALINKDDKPYR